MIVDPRMIFISESTKALANALLSNKALSEKVRECVQEILDYLQSAKKYKYDQIIECLVYHGSSRYRKLGEMLSSSYDLLDKENELVRSDLKALWCSDELKIFCRRDDWFVLFMPVITAAARLICDPMISETMREYLEEVIEYVLFASGKEIVEKRLYMEEIFSAISNLYREEMAYESVYYAMNESPKTMSMFTGQTAYIFIITKEKMSLHYFDGNKLILLSDNKEAINTIIQDAGIGFTNNKPVKLNEVESGFIEMYNPEIRFIRADLEAVNELGKQCRIKPEKDIGKVIENAGVFEILLTKLCSCAECGIDKLIYAGILENVKKVTRFFFAK